MVAPWCQTRTKSPLGGRGGRRLCCLSNLQSILFIDFYHGILSRAESPIAAVSENGRLSVTSRGFAFG